MPLSAPTADLAIQWADFYESRGWKPTPLHVCGPDGITCGCPKGANCGRSAGKHNIAASWQTDTRGAAIFREMLEGSPRDDGSRRPPRRKMNIGILTGEPSGIFVLDIDPKDGGMEQMAAFVKAHGPLPKTFLVKTGTGGYHYYFQMPDFKISNSASKIAKGLDIRSDGGMVVAAGSVSYAGTYTIVVDRPPAPAPQWLLDLLRQPEPLPQASLAHVGAASSAPIPAEGAAPVLGAAPAAVVSQPGAHAAYERSIIEGELRRVEQLSSAGWNVPWDNTTYQVACQLIELANAPWASLTLQEAQARFLQACPPPEANYLPEAKWASALAKIGTKARPEPAPPRASIDVFDSNPDVAHQGPPNPPQGGDGHLAGAVTTDGPFQLHDSGNAERLIRWHGDVLRFAADAETWMTYEGGRWRTESDVQVEAYAKNAFGLAMRQEGVLHSDVADEFFANGNPKPTQRERFYEWMMKSHMYAKVVAAMNMARSDHRMSVRLGDFDVDLMKFNAANCAVDLVTGQAYPHHPDQMFRHQASLAYDPGAECPLWLKFLSEVQPDRAMRDYLQEIAGYSLTGRMDEHAFFIHVGTGANGKSTFIEVINAILGDYGQKLDRETLLSKQSGGNAIPADIARMAGARFLAASEIPAGRRLDDERVKELVGGDSQTARHLYGQWFDFTPTAKIHMSTNHLPGLESGGEGMARRLKIIPWDVTIPDARKDKTLKERIIATEGPGVLAWLVRGAIRWNQGGLHAPDIVLERSKDHMEDADSLWPFIHERLVRDEPGCEVAFEPLLQAYTQWCSATGNKAMSGKAFSQALVERLGHEVRFKHYETRRSMFRLRVRPQVVSGGYGAVQDFWQEAKA